MPDPEKFTRTAATPAAGSGYSLGLRRAEWLLEGVERSLREGGAPAAAAHFHAALPYKRPKGLAQRKQRARWLKVLAALAEALAAPDAARAAISSASAAIALALFGERLRFSESERIDLYRPLMLLHNYSTGTPPEFDHEWPSTDEVLDAAETLSKALLYEEAVALLRRLLWLMKKTPHLEDHLDRPRVEAKLAEAGARAEAHRHAYYMTRPKPRHVWAEWLYEMERDDGKEALEQQRAGDRLPSREPSTNVVKFPARG